MTALPHRVGDVWHIGPRQATVEEACELALALDGLREAATAEVRRLRAEMLAGVEAPVAEVDERTLPLFTPTVTTPAEVERDGGKRASPTKTPRASADAEPPTRREAEAAYQFVACAADLCRVRDVAGWKQLDAARALGVPRATLERAELYGRGTHVGDTHRRAWERMEARLATLRGEVAA